MMPSEAPDATTPPSPDAASSKPLPWKGVLLLLVFGSAILSLISFAIPLVTGINPEDYTSTLRRYFDVGVEGNLPTWWAASLTMTAAVLSLAAGAVSRFGRIKGAGAWLILALIPFAFSVDEATIVHEHLDEIVDIFFDSPQVAYPWLIVGVPVAIAVIVTAAWCATRLPKLARNVLLLGYGVFFLGAVGFELLSGFLVAGEMNLLFMTLYNIEEFLEMSGAALMVVAPLTAFHYRSGAGVVHLTSANR